MNVTLVTPNFIQDPISRQHFPSAANEKSQDVVFFGRHYNLFSGASRAHGFEVDFNFAKSTPSRLLPARRLASQPDTNSRQELAQAKGFDDVIVSAKLQPHNSINLLALGG